MPANPESQTPTGFKKVRKKPRPPQQIAPEVWVAVEKAVCGGLGYTECGRCFGIEPHAIMARSRRNKWVVPSMVQKRVEALQRGRSKASERYKPYEKQRNSNELVVEVLAEDWVTKGERHRSLSFDLAHTALRNAAQAGLPIESWRDAHMADTVARRAAGLDQEDRAVNIGLQLVDARILASNLPMDAFKHLEETSVIPEAKTPA